MKSRTFGLEDLFHLMHSAQALVEPWTRHVRGPVGVVLVIAGVSAKPAIDPTLPVHNLGPVVARAKVPIGVANEIVELSDGRIVVNDVRKHQLVLFDRSLAHATIILEGGNKDARYHYPSSGGTPIPYRSDSILFADLIPAIPTMVRRDQRGLLPDGTIALVRARDYSIDWISPHGEVRSTARVMASRAV